MWVLTVGAYPTIMDVYSCYDTLRIKIYRELKISNFEFKWKNLYREEKYYWSFVTVDSNFSVSIDFSYYHLVRWFKAMKELVQTCLDTFHDLNRCSFIPLVFVLCTHFLHTSYQMFKNSRMYSMKDKIHSLSSTIK